MSSSRFEDGPQVRASVLQGAEAKLVAEAEHLRAELCLSRSTSEIVSFIKQTMEARAGSQNLTVLQTLCDREWTKTFNTTAATMMDCGTDFQDAIGDFLSLDGSPMSTRRTRKVANNAWKRDPAAERRKLAGSVSPYRGRPEIYDPDVLLAFADTIARVADRPRFTTGRHDEQTLSDGNKGDAIFEIFVASVRWAMVAAWQSAARPGTSPPVVNREGVLNAYKRIRGSTD